MTSLLLDKEIKLYCSRSFDLGVSYEKPTFKRFLKGYYGENWFNILKEKYGLNQIELNIKLNEASAHINSNINF